MRMRYALLLLLLVYAGCSTAPPVQPPAPVKAHSMKFQNATVEILLKDYSGRTGKRIDVVQGLDIHSPDISLQSKTPLTMEQYLATIEDKLKEMNIGLYPIGSNRLVAAWIDPSKAAQRTTMRIMGDTSAQGTKSYIERLRERRAATVRRQTPQAPIYTGEELKKHLQEYNMQLIRAARRVDTNAIPLPIPLTPGQEKELEEAEMPAPTSK